DLGLNDFRVDLANFIKTYGEIKNLPQGLHALTRAEEHAQKGMIFVLRNINSTVNIDKLNRLHPYYIVYIDLDGNIINSHLEPKRILDTLRYVCKGQMEPIHDVC